MSAVRATRVTGVTNPRTGALLALSAVCLIPGELAHPEPPAAAVDMLRLIASSTHWPLIHFVQIVGVLLFALGLVGATSLIDHAGRLWVRTVVIMGATILIAALAIDGDGFKWIADAPATPDGKGAIIATFSSLVFLQSAMLDVATFLLFGLGTALTGMSVAGTHYARAAARVGMVLGVIIALIGAFGFVHALPPGPWYPLTVLLSSVWAVWMGIALWRQTGPVARTEIPLVA